MKRTPPLTTITERDLENPQRFVGEGLGAPEAVINDVSSQLEVKAQQRADCLHCLCTK